MTIKLQYKLTLLFCVLTLLILFAAYLYINTRLNMKIVAAALLTALLFAAFFGYIVSAMISKPVIEMASVARKMARGDFSKKLYGHSNDEVGDLADALNYMSQELKSKLEKISYEEAKLDAVISSMFEGVMLTDKKGRITMINPSLRKLFLTDSAPEGKRPIEVLRNNKIQDMADRVLKERRREAGEETFPGMAEDRVIRISAAPIMDGEEVEGSIFVFHDITQLRRLERIRQDFVANVSHELKTPLANIKGYSETLLAGALEEKNSSREFTEIIHQESSRLAKLIDDLLDIARIESGKMKMVFLPVDVRAVITRTADVLKKSLLDKSISFELSTPEKTPPVLADEGRITQVLLNLLDNAIKYTPEGGAVKIAVSGIDDSVRIDVIDTGVGIPEKDIPRIFERFYRVDRARSRELGGTGLGLSIVKHIVQAHGGSVWAISAPGRGSTFSFTLPKSYPPSQNK